MVATNPRGQVVRCGTPGECDFEFTVPPNAPNNASIHVYIELKREGFDPRKLRGKGRQHFERQLDYMKKRNCDKTWLYGSAAARSSRGSIDSC